MKLAVANASRLPCDLSLAFPLLYCSSLHHCLTHPSLPVPPQAKPMRLWLLTAPSQASPAEVLIILKAPRLLYCGAAERHSPSWPSSFEMLLEAAKRLLVVQGRPAMADPLQPLLQACSAWKRGTET